LNGVRIDHHRANGPVLQGGRESTNRLPAPSPDDSVSARLLPTVLSLIAGSTDVIGFLALNGLFTAHITGNLVILAAHIARGVPAGLAPMLSVPMFVIVLGLARWLAGVLQSKQIASLLPLLLVQFLLLVGFLAVGVGTDAADSPDAPGAIVAGMLGVGAMAVQNALVQLSLKGVPSTAVMTTDVTRFVMDAGTVLLRYDRDEVEQATVRVKRTWSAIVGFAFGGGIGAICEIAFGLWSLLLPAGLALAAVALGASAQAAAEKRGTDQS